MAGGGRYGGDRAMAHFADLVARPEAEIPLDEAALLIAYHARPELDLGAELANLDDLAGGCKEPTLDALAGQDRKSVV